MLSNGRIVTGTYVATNGGRAFMMHLLGSDGEPIHSFDVVDEPSYAVESIPGPAADSGFWSARTNSSELAHWSPDATSSRRVQVRRPWFEPWTGGVEGESYVARARPTTVAVAEIAPGYLLLLSLRADPEWRPLGDDGRAFSFDPATLDYSSLYESVVELIDAHSGTVLQRVTVPEFLTPVQGTTDQFHSTRQGEDGHVVVDIWRVVSRSE